MNRAKWVKNITVIDPDTGLEVEVGIYKTCSGGIIGIDASYLEQDVGPVYCPFNGCELELEE